jgi:hypothetical protein
VADPARASAGFWLLFEDEHVPRTRSLRLNEPALAIDRDGPEHVLVEGECSFGVTHFQDKVGQPPGTDHGRL